MLVAIAAIACNKQDEIVPEINVTTTEFTIPVDGSEEEPFRIQFNANVDWTAALKETSEWCSIAPNSGVAGNATLSVYALENELEETRSVTIVITAGSAVKEVTVTQEALFVPRVEVVEQVNLAQAGCSETVTVNATVSFTVSVDEGADWLTVTKDGNTLTLTVSENSAYSARGAYVTLAADEYEEIGDKLYVYQEGRAVMLWSKALTSYGATMGNVKVAAYGEYLLLAVNGEVFVVKASDGTLVQKVALPEGFSVHSIAVDAGNNIVFAGPDAAFHGTYENTDDDEYISVYYVTGIETINNPVQLVSYNIENLWCTRAGNVRVNGNVTGDAVITAVSGCPWSEDNSNYGYWLAWEIKDGTVGDLVRNTIYAGSGNDTNTAVVYPLGASLSDGLMYVGYLSGLKYLADPETNSWVDSTPVYGSGWMETFSSISTAVYDGKTYAAVMSHCLFSYDNPELLIYDITNPENGVLIGDVQQVEHSYEHTGENAGYMLYPYSDAVLVSESGSLIAFVIDASYDTISCIVLE